MTIKIIFAGTPEIACPALSALINNKNCTVVAVYTQPDRPAGRGRKLSASPIKNLAIANNLTIEQPENFNDTNTSAKFKSYAADVMVVMAYGLLLPTQIINAPKNDCVNLHVSLLPRWRGAAPIARALWHGDQQTGVCLMRISEGLDCGPILASETLAISDTDSTASLSRKLAEIAANLLTENIAAINAKTISATEQDARLATYAKKIKKQDGAINWHNSSEQICLQIRACKPWPMAFSHLNGQAIRIISADNAAMQNAAPGEIIEVSKRGIIVGTGAGCINITELQLPGKKQLAVTACFNALQNWQGQQFNDQQN